MGNKGFFGGNREENFIICNNRNFSLLLNDPGDIHSFTNTNITVGILDFWVTPTNSDNSDGMDGPIPY